MHWCLSMFPMILTSDNIFCVHSVKSVEVLSAGRHSAQSLHPSQRTRLTKVESCCRSTTMTATQTCTLSDRWTFGQKYPLRKRNVSVQTSHAMSMHVAMLLHQTRREAAIHLQKKHSLPSVSRINKLRSSFSINILRP